MSDNTAADTPTPEAGRTRREPIDFALMRLVGGRNFRDLGGYPTADGRRVRRAMVYRSAHLATLTDGNPLAGLSLRTVVTLQSRAEVSVLGPPLAAAVGCACWEHIPIGDRWFDRDELPPPARSVSGHLMLVTDFAGQWRDFFRLAANPGVYPMLFHCSAGRDRTGMGAAMLLEMLGVERRLIVGDFLESNRTFPDLPLATRHIEPLFEAIDEAGGIAAFMNGVLGVGNADIKAIREVLLP